MSELIVKMIKMDGLRDLGSSSSVFSPIKNFAKEEVRVKSP